MADARELHQALLPPLRLPSALVADLREAELVRISLAVARSSSAFSRCLRAQAHPALADTFAATNIPAGHDHVFGAPLGRGHSTWRLEGCGSGPHARDDMGGPGLTSDLAFEKTWPLDPGKLVTRDQSIAVHLARGRSAPMRPVTWPSVASTEASATPDASEAAWSPRTWSVHCAAGAGNRSSERLDETQRRHRKPARGRLSDAPKQPCGLKLRKAQDQAYDHAAHGEQN